MKSRLLDPAWGRSVLPILLGLAAAHVIGTLFVRQSNLHLRYALYAAEPFKSFEQKSIWIVRLLAGLFMNHTQATPASSGICLLVGILLFIPVCQTYYALGQRSNPAAIGLIKDKMIASDHWYTQWYGYQAIKNLGWRQTR